MKTIKSKIFSVILLFVGVFFLTTCKPRECDTSITKPNDLLPIDRNAYNDVYTVWWNYRSNDGVPHEDIVRKDTIKIYGKFKNYSYHFSSQFGGNDNITMRLTDEQKPDFFDNHWENNSIEVMYYLDSSINKEELLVKLENWVSLKARFYVKGTLRGGAGGPDWCPASIYPYIMLNSLDDIYFEEEEK